jgi:hypothetical protein
VRLTLRPDLTEQSQFILYNQVVDNSQLNPAGGRGAEPVATGPGSGLRIGRTKLETEGGGAVMAGKEILLFN